MSVYLCVCLSPHAHTTALTQLSLLPSAERKMSTGQSAESFGDELFMITGYTNLFTLLYLLPHLTQSIEAGITQFHLPEDPVLVESRSLESFC